MASQITGVSIVYSAVCSGADQRKHQSSASLAFVWVGNLPMTGEFPTQNVSNAENVFVWWRHHEKYRRLFRRRSKKTPKLRVTGFCEKKSQHKGSVTRKVFPFDDVIMGVTSDTILPKVDHDNSWFSVHEKWFTCMWNKEFTTKMIQEKLLVPWKTELIDEC